MLTPAIPVDRRCVVCLDQSPAAVEPSPSLAWGLGWGLARAPDSRPDAPASWHLWHLGDNVDMQAFVASDLAGQRAIIVLTNSANGMSIMPDVVEAGYRAALALDSTDQRAARTLRWLEHPVRVAPALLDAYVGRYMAPFGLLAVARAADQLLVRVAGEPTAELIALTDHRFLVGDEGGPEITFETDGSGRVTHALLHLRGENIRAPRVP